MLIGTRAFVFALFTALGLAFVAETAVLAWEFWNHGWFSFLTQDSHLFLFFPTFGIVALTAFYVPGCAFVDLYWRHVRHGQARFLLGLLALAVASTLVAEGIDASPSRSVWEIAPQVLATDRSEPSGCGGQGRACERIALLQGIDNVRAVSRSRLGLKELVRSCDLEPLIEEVAVDERKRFCFASTPLAPAPRLSTDAECCRAQQRYAHTIMNLHGPVASRSLTAFVHGWVLPLKVFFLFVLFAISALLALRHRKVECMYPRSIVRIELGVLVGAVAMVFFPLMSQAFVQSADALYGTAQTSGFKPIVPLMSFAFGAWALLLLLFFHNRRDRDVELATKLAGVLASAVALFKYDLVVALIVRTMGSGASEFAIGILAASAIATVLILVSPWALRAGIDHDDREHAANHQR
jgi:hypothetical protein